ncbi:MAG: methyltransferase [Oligoflexia bacterium]|nr:MAG: methyltransferase [Oligoflexia bacterium]
MTTSEKTLTGYLTPEGFENDLKVEISLHPHIKCIHQWQRLFLVQGPPQNLAWAQLTLKNPQIMKISSIGDAAKLLKTQKCFWSPYLFHLHRRGTLIQEKLNKIPNTDYAFLQMIPNKKWGLWTLLSENEILFSSETNSALPSGEIHFQETKEAPSRAYLKLWEFFTTKQIYPQKGESCIDLGSCPGGWTWVLANLGVKVISVDTAPIDEKLLKNPQVQFLKKDAFKLKPDDVPPMDWVFSDIICTPARLYELVQVWLQSGRVKNMVCTIKFKGETDFATLSLFSQIPGSGIVHLNHNKHEVTWFRLNPS